MRQSDRSKNPFWRSHDKQIGEELHDEILLWLYRKCVNRNFVGELITWGTHEIESVKREIEYPLGKGFVDLSIQVRIVTKPPDDPPKQIWILGLVEVKSFVNLGTTLRQIKFYQKQAREVLPAEQHMKSTCSGSYVLLTSPTSRFYSNTILVSSRTIPPTRISTKCKTG